MSAGQLVQLLNDTTKRESNKAGWVNTANNIVTRWSYVENSPIFEENAKCTVLT